MLRAGLLGELVALVGMWLRISGSAAPAVGCSVLVRPMEGGVADPSWGGTQPRDRAPSPPRPGWNELLIASFSHRSIAVKDGILLATGLHVHRNSAHSAGVGAIFDRWVPRARFVEGVDVNMEIGIQGHKFKPLHVHPPET